MDVQQALDWASKRRVGTLITLRRDGRAQSSDITYWVRDSKVEISLTESRAKTRNMAADPRVVLHVSDPSTMSYVSLDGVAELSPTTERSGDATSDALVEYYRSVAGEHPDWDEYRQAMIDEKRLIATITINTAVGRIPA